MKSRLLSLMLALVLVLTLTAGPALAEAPAPMPAAQRADNLVTTHHTITIKGQEIAYTATAGTMAMDTNLGQYDLFFIAYTKDDVADLAERPITFCYNGGPGAASVYVNLGVFGPDKLALDEEGMVPKVPTETYENENSLLDLTDLVFIDPVGTGFSQAAEGTDPKTFWSLYSDIQSVGDFICQYISRNGRWASPRYLAGESYGTIRTAGLCDYLMNYRHIQLNGVMMISSCNNFDTVDFREGTDLAYASFLPTYAALAWYHKKAAESYLQMSLEEYLEEVRAFAGGEYWSALFNGDRLTGEEKDALAGKMADMIGLKKELILQRDLRINGNTFCTQLLADQKLTVGRIDGRYTGPVTAGSLDDGGADPAAAGVTEAYVNAFLNLVNQKLGYETDVRFEALSETVNGNWSFNMDNKVLSQEKIIHDCMSKNKYLKVWVICGYYDLATPFFGAEYTYNHLGLNSEFRDNLQFTYYPSGHMFYQHVPSYLQFRSEAEAWYGQR